ncbi:hypothetical protein H6F50_00050 [Coleofasciculus sp. FACHB-712]|uniref:hypothetical protein n=1 Tax=Coleofasciculus sp. FACHB-712 TaxID=2692789 RepID=UPI0016842E3C|nr:hypothetical protein [Coleofasciculus sp. FACHB-712]MBD1940748.1 hypothetical protein [Coleofasciculus sp. FACHB-712]
MSLIQESPSSESFTCPSCSQPLLSAKDGCGVCAWSHPLERKRKQASGTIYHTPKPRGLSVGHLPLTPKLPGHATLRTHVIGSGITAMKNAAVGAGDAEKCRYPKRRF